MATTDFSNFNNHSYYGVGSSVIALNIDTWDATLQLNQNNNGNQLIAIEQESSVETVDGISDGTIPIDYLAFKLDDNALFTLNSIHVVLNGFDSGFSGGNLTLVGYLNGSPVAGATETLNVTDVYSGGTDATFDVSANPAFQGIDSFRVEPETGHTVTGLIGVGAIDAVSYVAPPVITTSGGSASFVSGDNVASAPITIDDHLLAVDASSSTAVSATVSITSGFQSGEDVLGLPNPGAYGDIGASYNSSTGVLTLTSNSHATIAQWQAALDAVTYTDTAITPNTATRTISFSINDGTNNSTPATRTITITATDQTPILTATTTTPTYVSGAAPITIDSGVTVSDRNNTTLSSATISISNGLHSGDTLNFTPNAILYGNIAATSYNGTTGTLQLSSNSSTATLAQWQNALDAITFSSTSEVPGARTVSFVVNDGTVNSAPVSDTVTLLSGPVLAPDTGTASFVAGDNVASTPIAISPNLTATDGASATLASATIQITAGYHSGEDVLAFTNTNPTLFGAVSTASSSTGTLTLTSSGAATLAQWQAALDAVTYTDTAVTPNTTTRTIGISINDGTNTSPTVTRTITVAAVDQTPIVTTTAPSPTYIANTAAITIDSAITVSDRDNLTLASAQVQIGSGFQNGDTLAFSNTSAITFGNIVATAYDSITGTLALSSSGSTATLAQWQAALDAITFSSTSTVSGARSIGFTVNDGAVNSAAAADSVTVVAGPTLVASNGSAAFVAGDNVASTPVPVSPGLTLTDPSSPTLAAATVQITGNLHSGEDRLGFTGTPATGNIAASYDASTGVLSLSSAGATATLLQWQAALDRVTYTNTATTPNTATRTISFAVNDGAAASNTVTRTVSVATTDQTPIVTTSAATIAYLSNAAATPIDAAVTVTDRDNATLPSGTVAITTGFTVGDMLSFTNTDATAFGNIVGAYDAATGILSLSSAAATATTAQWQAALASITFSSTSAITGPRTIAYSVSDGAQTSAIATDTIDELGSTTAGSTTSVTQPNFIVPNSLTLPAGPLIVANTSASPATLTIQGGTLTSGTSIANAVSGITLGGASGTTGVITVTGSTSALNSNGSRVTIGQFGTGSLTVSGGGAVTASALDYSDTEAALSVAAGIGSLGSLTVTGASSQVVVNGTAVIGGTNTGFGVVAGGTGTVTVGAGATFQASAIVVGQGSTLTVAAGGTLNAPSLTLAGGTANLATLSSATSINLTATLPASLALTGAEEVSVVPSTTSAELQGSATVTANPHSNSLVLQSVSGAATINGLTFGDSIDLVGTADPTGVGTQFAAGAGSLTVNTPSGVAAYAESDGNGGTMITAVSTGIGLYRFFETTDGSHFYTASSTEAQTLEQTRPDLVFEGTSSLSAQTPGNGDPNATPVYRFFETTDGSHFYTASASERDAIIATRADLIFEPSATFYEDATQQANDLPVYRFFDSSNGTHFYTDSASEQASVLATRPDLVPEGIAFYAPAGTVT